MALGSSTLVGEQGQTTMRPNGVVRLTFAGEASYAAGGAVDFADVYLLAELGRQVTVTQVVGYGKTADVIDHYVDYDAANDKLKAYVLATGVQVAGAVDLSSVVFDLMIHYR